VVEGEGEIVVPKKKSVRPKRAIVKAE